MSITSNPSKRPSKAHAMSLMAFAAASALLMSACSDGSDDAGSNNLSADTDPHSPEVTKLTGATFRAPIAAGFVQAEKGGAAEQYGLELTPVWSESSTTAVSQVVSGDIEIAQSSYFGVIDAARQGIDIVIVSESYASNPEAATLETMPDSGIENLEDLAGKTVAVVSLNSSHAIKLRDAMIKENLDPDSVEFVELPYGEVASSLQQGTVDASSAQGASLEQAKNTLNTVTVFDYGANEYEGMAESGWIMQRAFAEENPNTVAAFQCAIIQGTEEVKDEETYHAVLQEDLDFSDEAIAVDVSPAWGAEIREEPLQMNADILLETGAIDEEFDMSSITIPTPDDCE